jgi:uncharacterized RDD family membrane protein YckC
MACAACLPEQAGEWAENVSVVRPQLDTRVLIVTPENIAFEYRLAGPFQRLPAYLIDLVLRTLVLGVLAFALVVVGWGTGLIGLGMAGWLVLWFVSDWLYGGLFEAFWNGQTPGKRLFRLRVLTVEGQPINAMQAVLRNVLRAVDAQPVLPLSTEFATGFHLLGLVAAAASGRLQRLGDLAAGTMVVVEQPQRLPDLVRLEIPAVVGLAARLPSNVVVSRSLARALAAYVQRRPQIRLERLSEIAQHVGEPLRVRMGLPRGISHDLLLCALYYRTFVGTPTEAATGGSPFAARAEGEPPAVLAGVPARGEFR